MDLTKDLIDRCHIEGVIISAFYLQVNDLIECGHDVLANSLAKYSQHNLSQWPKYLALTLCADWITV